MGRKSGPKQKKEKQKIIKDKGAKKKFSLKKLNLPGSFSGFWNYVKGIRSVHDVRLQHKMLSLTAMVLVGLLLVTGFGYVGMKEMNSNAVSMYNDRTVPIEYLLNIKANQNLSDSYLLQDMMTTDSKQQQQLLLSITDCDNQTNALIDEFKSTKMDASSAKIESDFETQLSNYMQSRNELMNLIQGGQNADAYQSYKDTVLPFRTAVQKDMGALVQHNEDIAAQLKTSTENQYKSTFTSFIIIFIVATLLSLTLGYFLSRIIVKSVNTLQKLMERAEAGDLTVQGNATHKDEFGRLNASFNHMISGLRNIVSKVQETAMTLSASSEELAASATETSQATEHVSTVVQDVADGAVKQASSVEEGSRAVLQLQAGIGSVAENAKTVSDSVSTTTELANNGMTSVEQSMTQMSHIQETVTNLGSKISGLGALSEEIGKMAKVIKDISGQTNLLSLNAAIEAARAGEHGKGFAVVAEEVRKLANESQTTTKKVEDLVKQIQADVEATVEAMDKSNHEVTAGIAVITTAGQSFRQIRESVETVNDQVSTMVQAAEQMATNSQQVAAAIQDVVGVTETTTAQTEEASAASQQQMASVQEIAASAQSLAHIAEQLQTLVSNFSI